MSSPTQASNRSPRMNRASAGVSDRKRSSAAVVFGRPSCRWMSEMKSMHRHEGGACRGGAPGKGGFPMASDLGGLGDDDVLQGHVVVEALAAGLDLFNGVDHLGAGHDLAEHG